MITAIVVLAIVIIAILVMAASRPDAFSVVRSAEYRATPETIFAQLDNFHNWQAWSPWEEMDPNLQRNYSGPVRGKGARYGWVGNKKVGEGTMEITRSAAPHSMELNLNFMRPFKASNVTEFTLMPKGEKTTLIWEMRGPSPFMVKIMHLFFDMDRIVGKDFEKGLVKLKAIVER